MDNTMVARFQVHVPGVSHRVCGYWRFVAADDDHYCGIAVKADRAIRHTCWSQSAGRTEQPFSSPSARFPARSLSFELGLLWSRLIRYAGSVISTPSCLRASRSSRKQFVWGIYLYRWSRVSGAFHLLSGIVVQERQLLVMS